jgi:hypothetical protein
MSEQEVYYDSLSAEVTAGAFRVLNSYTGNVSYDKFCRDMYEGTMTPSTRAQYELMRKSPMEYYYAADKTTQVKFCNALNNGPTGKPNKK